MLRDLLAFKKGSQEGLRLKSAIAETLIRTFHFEPQLLKHNSLIPYHIQSIKGSSDEKIQSCENCWKNLHVGAHRDQLVCELTSVRAGWIRDAVGAASHRSGFGHGEVHQAEWLAPHAVLATRKAFQELAVKALTLQQATEWLPTNSPAKSREQRRFLKRRAK